MEGKIGVKQGRPRTSWSPLGCIYLPILIDSDLDNLGPEGQVSILCWVAKHIPGPVVGTTVGGSGEKVGQSAALGQQCFCPV